MGMNLPREDRCADGGIRSLSVEGKLVKRLQPTGTSVALKAKL
jgi:hypothetical protein